MRLSRGTRLAVAGMAAGALVVTVAGCGDNDSSGGSGGGSGSGSGGGSGKIALAYDVGGRGDQSFNDAAAAGYDKARKAFHLQGKEVEPSEGESDADKTQRLTELARSGFDPVIAVGFVYAPALKQVAAKFPKTHFAIVDDASFTAKNVANLVFNDEQGAYLAGVAAAEATKTKRVGFVGGVETPLIKKFEAGYTQGVTDTDESVKVLTKYLTQPPDFSGFSKPDLGKDAATGQFDQNADVVFQAAGGAGTGVIEAAAARKRWAIGADADQYRQKALARYRSHILTSAIKDVSGSVYAMAKSVVDGHPQAGVIRRGLKQHGVSLATSNPAYRRDKALVKAVSAAEEKIKAGTITVRTKP